MKYAVAELTLTISPNRKPNHNPNLRHKEEDFGWTLAICIWIFLLIYFY